MKPRTHIFIFEKTLGRPYNKSKRTHSEKRFKYIFINMVLQSSFNYTLNVYINVSVLLNIWIITIVKQRYERSHGVRLFWQFLRSPFKIITPIFVAATEELFTRIGTLFLDSLHGTRFIVIAFGFLDFFLVCPHPQRARILPTCTRKIWSPIRLFQHVFNYTKLRGLPVTLTYRLRQTRCSPSCQSCLE